MNMGQITQGMRADALQLEQGQNINVAQLMESGVSFADIMLLILQNTQSIANGQGIPTSVMPQMNAETDGQLTEQFTDGQLDEMIYQNDMMFMPDMKNIISNIQDYKNESDKEIVDFSNMQNDVGNLIDSDTKQDIRNFDDVQNNSDTWQNVRNFDGVQNNSDTRQNVRNFDDVQNNSDKKLNIRNFDEVQNYPDNADNSISRDFPFAENIPVWSVSNDISDDNTAMMQVNSIADKLSDVLDLVSPEFTQASEKNSSLINNNFVIDLLSQLKTEREVKDSFDMSESMIKIDPMQLAGLLDYISTGNDIPQAMDIPDSHMFEKIENLTSVKASADSLTFDPQEMIKNGEMEIVSYIPAQKNSESSQQQSQKNDENTIDLARTMKSVKENVKAENNDDTAKFSEISASVTVSNPDELAQRKDISFERAFAELEMNKAKYGSADEQLYKGISDNLQKGRSEFTVKLRPEGLGEILVKLVSNEGGKAVLTMVASSEKTAELLNRDLASLQTSLNQHNVEIENNSVKVDETVMNSQTAFDQYNERQQDEAYQQQHFRQLKKKIGDISDRNISFDSETEPITASVADSALNITI